MDGLTVEELPAYLRKHWPVIRGQLLAGHYRPNAVKRCEIPKPGGGMRQLSIPTVLDRFIQQALLQVLQPMIDPTFSEHSYHSYGFRPGRRAHDAVCQAQRYVQGGRKWVVDIDLEKFFDRVNHDVLIGKLARRIADVRVLNLGAISEPEYWPTGWRWSATRGRAARWTIIAVIGERAAGSSGQGT